MSERIKNILTWHIHGNYLYYLTHTPHRFFLPVKAERLTGYAGRTPNFDWGSNVVEVPVSKVHELDIDVILYQSEQNYQTDQYEILSPAQRQVSKVYLEHNAPQNHPTNTRHHAVDDPSVLIAHVTEFNRLMWDNGENPTVVIEHGVTVPSDAVYTGELDRGVAAINNIHERGRRLGLDVFERVREEIPLDIVGMNADRVGGPGEIPYRELPYYLSRYRFFFSPIRYASLSLAMCEAMMVGLPVVGLGTTELAMVIQNGVTGFVHTSPELLIEKMRLLLTAPERAREMSGFARTYARERFGIARFAEAWRTVLANAAEGEYTTYLQRSRSV